MSNDLPRAEFAFPGPIRDRIVAAILAGDKTTTTGRLVEYEFDNEPLPQPGQRQVVVDSQDRPVAVIETVEVRVIRLCEVDLRHAVDEGEGHTTVEDWRRAHERFWQSMEMDAHLGQAQVPVDDDTLVVVERFGLVEVLYAG